MVFGEFDTVDILAEIQKDDLELESRSFAESGCLADSLVVNLDSFAASIYYY